MKILKVLLISLLLGSQVFAQTAQETIFGKLKIIPYADSTTVVNVADKDDNTLLAIDTTNDRVFIAVNVGIGTIVPTHKLEVLGAGIGIGTTVAGDSLIVDSLGNVGIGTNINLVSSLTVVGQIEVETATGNTAFLLQTGLGVDKFRIFHNNDSNIQLQIDDGIGGWAETITIQRTTAGIGIGTAGVGSKLHVFGTAPLFDVTGAGAGNSDHHLRITDGPFTPWAPYGGTLTAALQIQSGANSALVITPQTTGNSRLSTTNGFDIYTGATVGGFGGKIVMTMIGENVGIGTLLPNESLTVEAGVLSLKETTTPTATTNYAKIYSKDTNDLFYQDGAGAEHLIHGDAFSNIWWHGTTVDTVGIGTTNFFTVIDSFDNVGEEDDLANAVGNATTDDITIGATGGGSYDASFHLSISSNGAASEMVIVLGQTLNTAKTIATATNATPIVLGITGHGLLKGDMVTVVDATGNTAANGDWFLSAITPDTMTLVDLQGSNSVGNGVYNVDSGDITIVYHGNILMHRKVNQTDLGSGGAEADLDLVAGDKVKMYVANIGATRDLEVAAVNLKIERIGD